MIASVGCVSSLAIRRQLRRHQRHLALMAAVLVLGGLTAAHHGGPIMDRQHDDGMGPAVEMCLAVFTAIATVGALGFAVLRLQGWRPALTLLARAAVTVPRVPVARARHGPAAVSVLCVSRR